MVQVEATTVAEAYLALLRARGVEYLFANGGTDFPSIVEAFARAERAGFAVPAPVIVPHEHTALSMAHGYWMVSGRMQAVMVHVSVGTANGVCAIVNAARENVPILFTAGRSPLTEHSRTGSRSSPIHWAQEMFDQAGMVRECVKWDYELRGPDGLEQIVDRALAIADSEPRGPVYLSLPREVLAGPVEGLRYDLPPRIKPASESHPDPEVVSQAAETLAAARHPLIIVGRSGQCPETPALLARLAERFALPVVEFWSSYLGLASDHPMHSGYDPHAMLGIADAVLLLDCDVPWIPERCGPAGGCTVIQMGPDPLFGGYPVRGFPADMGITCSTRAGLLALEAALDPLLAGEAAAIDARRGEIAARHETWRRDALDAAAANPAPSGRMSKAFISKCLSEAKADDAIVVSEYPLVREVMTFRRPATFFDQCSAAGLGWGVPAALGAKLARRDRQVIAAVGDGSCLFANPAVCHQVSAALELPVLMVVFNNGRWDAVRMATQGMYPDGVAVASNRMPLTSLEPSPAYERYAEASGGYGERVEDPAALPGAIRRGLEAVDGGQQALLNVMCE